MLFDRECSFGAAPFAASPRLSADRRREPPTNPGSKRHHVELLRPSLTLQALKGRLDTDFPPVAHPAVYVQKETGRKVLNVSAMFVEGIVGMDRDEGGALLDEIFDHSAAYQKVRNCAASRRAASCFRRSSGVTSGVSAGR